MYKWSYNQITLRSHFLLSLAIVTMLQTIIIIVIIGKAYYLLVCTFTQNHKVIKFKEW